MRTSIPISSGKAAISFDFSSAFTWPIAIFSRDEYALTTHGCLPSSPYALRRHLPSRWLMFASRLPGSPDTARLLSESRELTLIFGKSVNTASQGRG